MTITLEPPKLTELRPRITVVGVGGAGCNAVNNMIAAGLSGVEFVVANTDAQALAASSAEHRVQLGASLTEGLGAGAKPEIGQAAAEEAIEDIRAHVAGAHMVFVAGGMGGGTGTGAAAVIARTAKELGILTVGVVTKPFQFEGARRMRIAEAGIGELRKYVDTLIVIPNQNLFRIANDKTTFAEAFVLADQVLYSGVACIVDLIIKEGLINLDFADVRTVMSGMGTAMMGTGEATGERRAIVAAEEAISNPLLDDISLKGAKGLLLSITGGRNLTLYEVDEAASRVRQEVDPDANIIVGATFDEALGERVRVSIVASGMAGTGVPGAVAADRAPAPSAGKPASEFWPRAHAAPAPQTTAAPAPQAAVHRGPAEVHHQPGRPNEDVQRRLSEALQHGAAHAPQPPAAAAAPHAPHHEAARSSETWRGPGGVTIEEGPLHGSRDQHLPPPIPPVQVQPAPSLGSAFSPAPPAEIRRQPRRMPELEDFPPIGQREFRARRDQPGEGQRTVGDADWHPESEPKKRFSLFDRLRRRSQRAKEAGGFDNDQSSGWAEVEPDYSSVNNKIRAQTTGVPPHGGVSKSAERSDLPEFFSRKRR